MQDEFLLLVKFQGKEFQLLCKLIKYTYIHKLEVDIDGIRIFFEPDEERNWRALVSYEDLQSNKNLNVDLLKVIAETIEETLN